MEALAEPGFDVEAEHEGRQSQGDGIALLRDCKILSSPSVIQHHRPRPPAQGRPVTTFPGQGITPQQIQTSQNRIIFILPQRNNLLTFRRPTPQLTQPGNAMTQTTTNNVSSRAVPYRVVGTQKSNVIRHRQTSQQAVPKLKVGQTPTQFVPTLKFGQTSKQAIPPPKVGQTSQEGAPTGFPPNVTIVGHPPYRRPQLHLQKSPEILNMERTLANMSEKDQHTVHLMKIFLSNIWSKGSVRLKAKVKKFLEGCDQSFFEICEEIGPIFPYETEIIQMFRSHYRAQKNSPLIINVQVEENVIKDFNEYQAKETAEAIKSFMSKKRYA